MPDTDDRDSPSEDEATLWPADVLGEPRYPGEFDVADSLTLTADSGVV